MVVRGANPRVAENPWITFDSPKLFLFLKILLISERAQAHAEGAGGRKVEGGAEEERESRADSPLRMEPNSGWRMGGYNPRTPRS